MNFTDYQPLAMRTAKLFPDQGVNLRHSILGLTTEIGEFATEVKRIVVYGKPMDDAMRKHMIEEIGDAQWYVPLGLYSLGLSKLPGVHKEQLESLPSGLADTTVFLSAMAGGIAAGYTAGYDANDIELLGQMLSGVVYCIDTVIAPLLDTTGDEIRRVNIDKLRLRFPDAYSDAAAEARADKGGLSASES
jgi:hypothetical protein